jgi:hypothetical protein
MISFITLLTAMQSNTNPKPVPAADGESGAREEGSDDGEPEKDDV